MLTAVLLAVGTVPVAADPKPPDVCTSLAEAAMHPLDCTGKALSYSAKGEIAAAKASVLDDITGSIVDGVEWISGAVGDSLKTSGAPDVQKAWFTDTFTATRSIGAMFALIALLCSSIYAALTRDGREIGRSFAQVLTAGVSCGIIGALVTMANSFMDYACDVALGADGWSSITDALRAVAHTMNVSASHNPDPTVTLLPSIVVIFLGLLIIICLGVIWCEMLIRRMAVDICVAFWPLAVSGSIWKKSRQWQQRLIDTLLVVELAKPVIVIMLRLASDTLKNAHSPADLVLACGLYAVAAFAPYIVMQMIGVIGGAANPGGTTGGMRQAGFGGVAGMAAGVAALTGAASKLGGGGGGPARGGSTKTPSAAGQAAAATGPQGAAFAAGLAALQTSARPMLQAGRNMAGANAGQLPGGGGGGSQALSAGVIPGQLTGSSNRPALPPGSGGGGTGGGTGGGGAPALPPGGGSGGGGGAAPAAGNGGGAPAAPAGGPAGRSGGGSNRYALTAPVRPNPPVHSMPARTPGRS
ncbi:hypothetical protein ACFV1W_25340 [Kitasatospora sp. NPDC059648]|uniref:hypothetical protein n=1 Tax=Kitasatospora sp. NPDC059648 TaxID=3346894 RepID=UPI0036C6AF48